MWLGFCSRGKFRICIGGVLGLSRGRFREGELCWIAEPSCSGSSFESSMGAFGLLMVCALREFPFLWRWHSRWTLNNLWFRGDGDRMRLDVNDGGGIRFDGSGGSPEHKALLISSYDDSHCPFYLNWTQMSVYSLWVLHLLECWTPRAGLLLLKTYPRLRRIKIHIRLQRQFEVAIS